VFVGRIGVIVGDGRVVHRANGQTDRGRGGIGAAVAGLVSEAVGAVVIAGRGVSEAAVGIERERAVAGAADERGGENVAIDVGVVCQLSGGGDCHQLVIICGLIYTSRRWR